MDRHRHTDVHAFGPVDRKTCGQSNIKSYVQIDIRAYIAVQTGINCWWDGYTDRTDVKICTGRQTDLTYGCIWHKDTCTGGWMDRWTNDWMDIMIEGETDRWAGGWVGRRTDEKTEIEADWQKSLSVYRDNYSSKVNKLYSQKVKIDLIFIFYI